MKKKVINWIVLLIAIVGFCISGYKIYEILSEYWKGSSEYERLRDITIQTEVKDGIPSNDLPFTVDFEVLLSMNPDTVGWIRFAEPKEISYPVVRGTDNEKYLNKTFEGKKNAAGALFEDYRNATDFSDRNTFIYGHNMKNGSMFGQLRKYRDSAYCEENPYFYIYTPDGKVSTYQIFAVGIVEDTTRSYTRFFSDDEEFLEYIDYIRGISRYKSDVEIVAESKVVSLSTCTNRSETERMVVHGVKIHEE